MTESLVAAAIIFCLRCSEVSIGTMRVVFAVEGRRSLAAALAFGEATIFIIGASIVLSDIGDPIRILGYSSGFALGTVVGVTVSRALKLGTVTIRIISPHGPIGVAEALRIAGFNVSTFDGESSDGPIRLILLNVSRRHVARVLATARPWLEDCFVTVGDEPLPGSVYPSAFAVRK